MKAEKLAEVPKQRGSLWHAYLRKWATERKHLPDVDVAAAGGWTETDSLKQCYQQADEATMLDISCQLSALAGRWLPCFAIAPDSEKAES